MAGTDQTHLSASTSTSHLANKLKLVWPRKGQLGGVELILSYIIQIMNSNKLVVGIKITNKEVRLVLIHLFVNIQSGFGRRQIVAFMR